jgi:BTB/POZ domain-containing protein KCTD9
LLINKVKFLPGEFLPNEKVLGELYFKNNLWLNDSLILNIDECVSLIEMTKSKNGRLLYRATRDGFTAQAFHSKCDIKGNTITLIKTDSDYVFGGFSINQWNSLSSWSYDSTAFIFSLRRMGLSCNHEFMSKNNKIAICGYPSYGAIFGGCDSSGGQHDICIIDKSDAAHGSYASCTNCFVAPSNLNLKDFDSFLAGSYKGWLTAEIEVFKIE